MEACASFFAHFRHLKQVWDHETMSYIQLIYSDHCLPMLIFVCTTNSKGYLKCFRIYEIYTKYIYMCVCVLCIYIYVYVYVYKSSIDFICVSLVSNHIDRERESATNCQRGQRLVRKESRFQDVFRSCDVLRQAAPCGAMRRMANRHDPMKPIKTMRWIVVLICFNSQSV